MKMKKQAVKTPSLSTRAIHGNKLYAYKGPVATPIYQTSTYRFETSEDAVRYAKGDPSVYVYTRYHNPTVHDVEEKIALMERGEAAALFSSGMAAITTAILAFTKPGDEIISTAALYGGTYRWFRDEMPRNNITVKFVHPDRLDQLEKLATPKTTIVYVETPTNPTLDIVDIGEVVKRTRNAERKSGRKIIVMVDNTFASIVNQDPLGSNGSLMVRGTVDGPRSITGCGTPRSSAVFRRGASAPAAAATIRSARDARMELRKIKD